MSSMTRYRNSLVIARGGAVLSDVDIARLLESIGEVIVAHREQLEVIHVRSVMDSTC